jgi:hypothetical protein
MKKLLVLSLLTLSSSLIILKAQSGIITTVAGNGFAAGSGNGGYSGDGGQATLAEFWTNSSVCVDTNSGNIYIADSYNNRIRKVSTTGLISTFAGNGYGGGINTGGYSGDGGQATLAEIYYPVCVRVDVNGNVYISDNGNGVIRKVNTSGVISTYAGNGDGGYSGDGGAATAAEFAAPTGICLDRNSNLYVADQTNNVIRKITSSGLISTVAGMGPLAAGYTGNGGPAIAAELNWPDGGCIDPNGNLYISEINNNVVRMVDAGGNISLFAGKQSLVGNFNGFSGTPDTTEMYNPSGLSSDGAGNIYIADPGNAVVWEVLKSNNMMYAIAGTVDDGYSGDGGPAYLCELNYDFDVMPDQHGNIFIDDLGNNVIRKIAQACAGDSATAVSYNYPECNGGTDGIIVAFAVSPFAPYAYSWSNGTTNDTDLSVPAGDYTVTVTDAFGCTGTGSVLITQPTAIAINVSGLDSICLNDSVKLTVSASGGMGPLTFVWDENGSTADTIWVTPTGNSSYTVYVNDTNGCYDSTVFVVTVNPIPSVILNAQSYLVCPFDTDDTLAGYPPGGRYAGPDLTGNHFNPSVAGTGTYNFTYTYTDSIGCSAIALQTIVVNVCAGIKSLSNEERILVYPNPATNEFTIQLGNGDAAQLIELYSITGQQVYQYKYSSTENAQTSTINTEQFPTGVYILKVLLQDGSTLVQKVDIVK